MMLKQRIRLCMVACDNGLGHVRRVAMVAAEVARLGGEVTVFARKEQARRFGIVARHFETRTSQEALRRGDPEAWTWHDRLPPLDRYDLVVSDNLPEILLRRPDAVLMGSFLWHMALEGLPPARVNVVERLLRSRPVMLGSGLFASPSLLEVTRFVDVGLVTIGSSPAGSGKDLLLSCGMSGACEDQVREGVRAILCRGPTPFRRVHIEPRLLPASAPDWMVAADFSRTMYAEIAVAVIRPGVGTATDAIHAGCRLLCFYENGNRELALNAGRIASQGLGDDAGTVENALALAYGWDGTLSPSTPASLGVDGASRAAEYLLGLGAARSSGIERRRDVAGSVRPVG